MDDNVDERERSRSPVSRSRSRSRSPRRNRNDRPQRPFQGGTRVIVRNIPYEIRWQQLKDTFRKEIGDVTFVEMLETPQGKSKGVAVVEFRDPQHAKKAIEEFHQRKLNDRAIIVREEREKDRQEFMQNQSMRYMDGDGPGMGGPGNMSGRGVMGPGPGPGAGYGGVSPQILQQLGIEPPISNTVFVANLDYKVTWWKLKDVFKLAGNVIKAEIKEDKNGKSRGMGVVSFEHPMEAVQAVSMFNGQALYDRNMIVRVDKGPEPDNKPKLPSGLKSIGMGLGMGGAPVTNFSQQNFNQQNYNQMGNNGGFGMTEPFLKQEIQGLGGGSGLMGMGNLGVGVGSGLGLMGSGVGGGGEMGLAGLGGNLGGVGLGFGGSTPLNSASTGGLAGSLSDLGLGGASKMVGLSDNFSNNSFAGLGGSNYNGNMSGLGGLGGLGPGLNSLSAGLLGSGTERLAMGNLERLGLGEGMSRDRFGMSMMGMGMDKMRDSYGSGREMRDDGGRRPTRPGNCTLIVKNLPYSTHWQALKEHFRDAGDVKFAEIVLDNGRSTGVGYVRFSNEAEAQRAIGLKNRSRIERRTIDVALHRN